MGQEGFGWKLWILYRRHEILAIHTKTFVFTKQDWTELRDLVSCLGCLNHWTGSRPGTTTSGKLPEGSSLTEIEGPSGWRPRQEGEREPGA